MISYGLLSTIGSVFGILGLLLLFFQFCLGIRFISRVFTVDLIKINKLHQKTGTYGIILILIHPAIKLLVYGQSLLSIYPTNSFEMGVFFGKIAIILYLITWVLSAVLRSRIRYRPWLYTHYSNYFLVVFVFIHPNSIGPIINSNDVLHILWKIFFYLFVLILILRFLKFLGIGNLKYRLVKKEIVGGDIMILRFLAVNKQVNPKPGQFTYLQTHMAGESHPFSCMEVENSGEFLTFGIKIVGKFTKNISKLKINHLVSLDGPYGVFTSEGHNETPKVLVAGGIGITPFVELVKRFGNDNTYLFYSIRFLEDDFVRDKMKNVIGNNFIEIVTREKIEDPQIKNSKLSTTDFKDILPEDFFGKAKFFICGSKGFYEYYRNVLLTLNVAASNIYYEKFEL